MNVKLFRLNSGEEILARFTEKDEFYTLKDPAVLIPMQQQQIAIAPWMVYSEAAKGVDIPKSYIAFIVEPVKELKDQYDSAVNKGIVAPSSSLKSKTSMKLTID